MTELRGIAWNHTRGFTPMVATAQRFEELNPGIRITWEKRSLQSFADEPMSELASRYDLIVMDHPHTAMAAAQGVLLALDDHLPPDFLQDQASHSVGQSHFSYRYQGSQWTLATDAAAPVSTWREDLRSSAELQLPHTWDDVLALARQGLVAAALFPVDVLMHVYMFCAALGEPAFERDDALTGDTTLKGALECLRELACHCKTDCLHRNPIVTAEVMTRTDEAIYCPFAYGYSNYSRPGYGPRTLQAGGLVTFCGERLRSTLGGAGLAVSARTAHVQCCMDYLQFTSSPETQRGLYFETGGQPGHRSAWLDEKVNSASTNFFSSTLETLDEALVRPQYEGYMQFQDKASPIAHDYVAGKASLSGTVEALNQIYRASRAGHRS